MGKKRKKRTQRFDPDSQIVVCIRCGLRQKTAYQSEFVVTPCKGGCGSVVAISESYAAIRAAAVGS